MQTTLRINDDLYREAKAQAAREGITLTRFLESALQQKLAKSQAPAAGKPHFFTVYDPGTPFPFTADDLKRIGNEEQEKHDLEKLGLLSTHQSDASLHS
jgi:hypothetical protein